MTDPIPDSAVEAAARTLCAITSDDGSGWYCETHGTEIHVAGLYYCATGEDDARAALTAAAPLIAAQATVALEESRDWWKSTCEFWNESATKAWGQRDSAAFSVKQLERELNDLRAGIEALRDEWQGNAATISGSALPPVALEARIWTQCADALDALLRGAKS